jgi:DNA-binding response OmpR family regulator
MGESSFEQYCRTRKRVLVVEDDDGLRGSLATALAGDYEIHTVGSGGAAVKFLRKHSVDAVLLDMVMPDGDGFTVLTQASRMRPAPRIAVLSAETQVGKAVRAMQLGAADYLVKPCPLDEVRGCLSELVRGEPMAAAAT